MPRKRWIPKESAQTYRLLYRSQDDPLINDEDIGDRALFQISGPSASSSSQSASQRQKDGLHLHDLEDDVDLDSMRDNEGEAAEHGIYFDDTKYDYMQHLRDIGDGSGDSHFIESIPTKVRGKGKAKAMKLEDALREVSIEDDAQSRYTSSVYEDNFSTMSTKSRTLEMQQDIPDEIAGFQPDMDPRLREALEALEDDAYVDDKDEDDVFGELGFDGKNGELSLDEFEMTYDDDEGWESDVTEKAPKQSPKPQLLQAEVALSASEDAPTSTDDPSIPDAEQASAADGDWLAAFSKYKQSQHLQKAKAAPGAASIVAASSINDKAPSLYTLNGTPLRQKKRKGAMTNPSAYSMTSSSLMRTEGQQLLDARFDRVEKMYALDEEGDDMDVDGGMSVVSGMTGNSKMSQLSTTSFADEGAVRTDWGGMMDGFLGEWEKSNPGGGKRRGAKGKRGKNGNEVEGLRQLDEVRGQLGRGRVRDGMKVV
jgi:protein LTV1